MTLPFDKTNNINVHYKQWILKNSIELFWRLDVNSCVLYLAYIVQILGSEYWYATEACFTNMFTEVPKYYYKVLAPPPSSLLPPPPLTKILNEGLLILAPYSTFEDLTILIMYGYRHGDDKQCV